MDSFIESLRGKYCGATLPFEEFATEIAEYAFANRVCRNNLALQIFDTDWSTYETVRGNVRYKMSDILKEGQKMEHDHILFVRTLPSTILPGNTSQERFLFPNHDHSKDDFYILMCALRFRCPNFDIVEYKWFTRFVELMVFKPHYRIEPHHPEYEVCVPDGECSLDDVTETAIDRMARNYQFSNGKGDVDILRKYQPTWSKNNKRNVDHYNSIIDLLYESIGECWRRR